MERNFDKTNFFNKILILGSINGEVLEVFQEYVYLRQTLQLGRDNFECETPRRMQLS